MITSLIEDIPQSFLCLLIIYLYAIFVEVVLYSVYTVFYWI